jgi:hypothetical protein
MTVVDMRKMRVILVSADELVETSTVGGLKCNNRNDY